MSVRGQIWQDLFYLPSWRILSDSDGTPTALAGAPFFLQLTWDKVRRVVTEANVYSSTFRAEHLGTLRFNWRSTAAGRCVSVHPISLERESVKIAIFRWLLFFSNLNQVQHSIHLINPNDLPLLRKMGARMMTRAEASAPLPALYVPAELCIEKNEYPVTKRFERDRVVLYPVSADKEKVQPTQFSLPFEEFHPSMPAADKQVASQREAKASNASILHPIITEAEY